MPTSMRDVCVTFRVHAEAVAAQSPVSPLADQLPVVLVRGAETFITFRSPTAKGKQTNVTAFYTGSFLYPCGKIN